MVSVLIVDLDGVLRHWGAELATQTEQRHGLALGSIHAAAFDPGLLRPALTGHVSDEEWRARIAQRLSVEHGVDATGAVAEWSRPCGRVDSEVLHLLRRQRQQRRVAVLTNATTRLHADLALLGLDSEVDAVFSSAELGVAKPDPEVFRRTCASLGVAPAGCAFVDDSPENVHAAVALGMSGHLYRTAHDLSVFLDGLPSASAC
ncbi:HAD family hydrolase [Cellulomonas phragmiteti]|uniref:Haloacid dehalogenase n=1 Tax=Cellulomonas phragmiteti TaxID=478780 RepID=A0ABQ4DJ02_9CELL|nr:HAD-IA family hydrolase [Cellulomonas phragmiteti]GIG39313.1 hypothetical protein Cph01nite_10750 [Cellulomonas phragmiteti]